MSTADNLGPQFTGKHADTYNAWQPRHEESGHEGESTKTCPTCVSQRQADRSYTRQRDKR